MKTPERMIFRLFVQRFYAQNSGFFLFLFIVMFGIVQTLTESLIIEYHYHLIIGMLGSNLIFLMIILLWLIYQLKCFQFVTAVLDAPEFSFLAIINTLPKRRVFRLLFWMQVFLYLPVLLYSFAILGVALYHNLVAKSFLIILFHFSTCLILARYYQKKIVYCGETANNFIKPKIPFLPKPYFTFLLSYLLSNLKFLYLGIKAFTCILLFAFLKNLEQNDYDFRLMMLIYTMALIGNSVNIYKLRMFEETYLAFYRQLAVSKINRWTQYIIFYLVMMIPEFLLLFRFMPLPLHYTDGFTILFYTLSFFLLQHAILSCWWMGLPRFLKIATAIYFVLYFFIISGHLVTLAISLFIISFTLFVNRYFEFEMRKQTG